MIKVSVYLDLDRVWYFQVLWFFGFMVKDGIEFNGRQKFGKKVKNSMSFFTFGYSCQSGRSMRPLVLHRL